MRPFVLLQCLSALLVPALAGQDSVPTSDSAAAVVVPPPPTPAQSRYLVGLRTTGRGVAQLRDGVARVVRYSAKSDTARVRQAGSRLAGMCGAARGFMTNGRAQMQPTAYEDSTRTKARSLVVQIDSLIRYIPTCEARASRLPDRTAGELFDRLQAYDVVLRDFRMAIGLPNR